MDAALGKWLRETDPALRWQVERDLLGEPTATWQATRHLVASEGVSAKLLALQDEDGQWAGGAYFPGREEARAITNPADGDGGQPYIATTWSLNSLREWGLDATILGETADLLAKNSRWEYENLPYWGGEVDACINSFTLANGAWLGVDVSAIADWFIEHQLADGGWNCDWIEGATKSSIESTLNSLIGILWYERAVGHNAQLTEARRRGAEYLLERRLMFKKSDGTVIGDWVKTWAYPFRWHYSILRALDYLRDASDFDGTPKDPRAGEAIEVLRSGADASGRWAANTRYRGQVWFEVDSAKGEPSPWLTLYATRVLQWWDGAST